MNTKAIVGGVGDFILQIDSAIQDEMPIKVITHFKKAPEFFDPIKEFVKVEEYIYFDTIDELNKLGHIKRFTYNLTPKLPWPYHISDIAKKFQLRSTRKRLAIHPFGSEQWKRFWSPHGVPLKEIDPKYIDYIIGKVSQKYDCFIFGSKAELDSINLNNNHTKIYGNIWESLIAAYICDAMIGTDSSIKTLTASQWITSHVFHPDIPHNYKDCLFLDPYVKANIMKVYPFTEQNEALFDPAIEALLK